MFYEAVLKICASPMCRAETSFFVAPSEARGPSALTRLGRTWMGCRPEPLFFFVAPRRKPRGLPPVDAVPNEVAQLLQPLNQLAYVFRKSNRPSQLRNG
jgi:hypothetical protein